MTTSILICTDLDRTLLPNGKAEESPQARALFSAFVSRPDVLLVYVSGRHKALICEAIAEYDLPQPDFAIGDVGTTLYTVTASGWQESEAWAMDIAADWAGYDHAQLQSLLANHAALRLQEAAKQNRSKLSYYLPLETDTEYLIQNIQTELSARGVHAELVYSVDEAESIGLLDILPACATKFHAVEFLIKQLAIEPKNTVFAGDSGNDLPVMASEIQSVLVANASPEIQRQAQEMALKQGNQNQLYLAQGHFLGLNGNYAAGILEGIAHYLPHTRLWMNNHD